MQDSTTRTGLRAGDLAPGDRVALIAAPFWVGTVTRVIDADGEIGGIAEVRWDHQVRVSRSAGFQGGQDLRRA